MVVAADDDDDNWERGRNLQTHGESALNKMKRLIRETIHLACMLEYIICMYVSYKYVGARPSTVGVP